MSILALLADFVKINEVKLGTSQLNRVLNVAEHMEPIRDYYILHTRAHEPNHSVFQVETEHGFILRFSCDSICSLSIAKQACDQLQRTVYSGKPCRCIGSSSEYLRRCDQSL